MKKLGILAIVAALAVLLALTLKNRKDRKDLRVAEQKQVLHLVKDQVKSVVVYRQYANAPVVRFERRGDNWWITEPEKYPAANYNVDSIIREATSLQSDRRIVPADVDKTFAAFGVTDPRFRVTLSDGTIRAVLAIGDKMAIGNRVYARAGTGDEVYLIKDSLENYLNKKVSDWRRRDLFWNFPTKISSVELAFANRITRMIAMPGTMTTMWKTASGQELQAKKVEDLIRSVKNLSATTFSDESLGSIDRAVRLKTGQGEIVVLLHKVGKDYLAEVPGRPFRYKLGKYGVDRIFPKMKDLLPPPPKPVRAAAGVTTP